MVFHYINLTNGRNCPHYKQLFRDDGLAGKTRYIRLQSTWCEQKRWSDILLTLGADFYLSLAAGVPCVVHDQSERDRETRACWQGLSWVRHACTYAWKEEVRTSYVRNGVNVTAYWQEQYAQLPPTTHTFLSYFRKFYNGGPVLLESCYGGPVQIDQLDEQAGVGMRLAGDLYGGSRRVA